MERFGCCGHGAMVLGHSVVMGVCDRGAKASWRDRGILDKSSCLMVLLDGVRWLGHAAVDGWTRLLFICSKGFLR